MYDPEGQPLPQEFQRLPVSPVTKEQAEKRFKEGRKAADPALSDGDVEEDWRLVSRQWDWLVTNKRGKAEGSSASTCS